jgi:phosphoribosylamine--glycine ligase
MKEVVTAAGVPTAGHATFTEAEPALAHLDTLAPPFVIKTDGLAAGKGVLVTESLTEARNAVGDYLSGAAFGDAGRTLVIEEGLIGPELSVLAVCDGHRSVPLAPAQDFKRIGDGDRGPNTGGMGAYSPVPQLVAGDVLAEVNERFVEPTLAELRSRGIDYRGVLYAGLMFTASGLRLIEFNVRFGDPETQVVVPRLTSDLAALLAQAAAGRIEEEPVFSDDAVVTVVLATEGYPGTARTGDRIEGLDEADRMEGVTVFRAGVAAHADGGLVTAGGRVLDVCGRGATLAEARERAYAAVARISWPGMQHRGDIAATAAAG